jgi:RNA polymerase sigma-70 factor (ECF subfamily)
MGFSPGRDMGIAWEPPSELREHFGFVPALFRAQCAMPRLVEAEVRLLTAVTGPGRLSRAEKERMLLGVASALANAYCVALYYQTLLVSGAPEEELDRIIVESQRGRAAGLTHEKPDDRAALEAVQCVALGRFLCALSAELGVAPDFEPPAVFGGAAPALEAEWFLLFEGRVRRAEAPEHSAGENAPLGVLRECFGCVPDVFRAQTLTPETLRAEAMLIQAALAEDGPAKRAIGEFMRALEQGLGVTSDASQPGRFTDSAYEKPHLPQPETRLNHEDIEGDPDARTAEQAKRGDLDAFEELVNRHGRRVYRTLVGILGSRDEARDAMQDTLLKAFEKLGSFEGRSKFSTWLLSIATNAGIQRLRERKQFESIDDPGAEHEEGFRPRQIQAWTEDPEKLYSREEARALIERSVMGLPAKYRVVLLLRDIDQLSTEEAAAALGLGVPAVKARLLRGRLLLREALAPHFAAAASRSGAKGAAV